MSTLQSFFCTRIFRILFSMILAVSFTPLNGQQVRATSDIEVMELIKDIRPGVESSQIWDVTPSGEHIFFTADDGVNGSELWVSDGTSTGTHLVKDLNPGSGGTTFEFMTPFFGQLLFFAITPADNEQLWISDGTSDGTHIVKKFYPGIASRWQPVVFNNRMIFYDNRQLWVTDGTEAGTLLLLDVSSGINTGLNSLIAGQNQAFFVGWEPTKFYLGITDGTPEGTSRLVDPYDIPSFPYFFSIDNTLYFYEKTTPSQVQLFKMELNSRTKTLLHTFEDGKYEYKLKSFTQADGNTFYFLAILDVKYPDTNFKTELWVSDGTQAGTKQVINLPSADAIKELFWQSPYLYFSSFSWDISPSIARTDGTSQRFVQLISKQNLSEDYHPNFFLASTGGQMYYQTTGAGWKNTTTNGLRLWTTGGTPETTVEVKFMSEKGYILSQAVYQKRLYMITSPIEGSNWPIYLWRSDGTSSGTTILQTWERGNQASFWFLGTAGDRLLYKAYDANSGSELWSLRTDPSLSIFLPLLKR